MLAIFDRLHNELIVIDAIKGRGEGVLLLAMHMAAGARALAKKRGLYACTVTKRI